MKSHQTCPLFILKVEWRCYQIRVPILAYSWASNKCGGADKYNVLNDADVFEQL